MSNFIKNFLKSVLLILFIFWWSWAKPEILFVWDCYRNQEADYLRKGDYFCIRARNHCAYDEWHFCRTWKVFLNGRELSYAYRLDDKIGKIYLHFSFEGKWCLQIQDANGIRSDCYSVKWEKKIHPLIDEVIIQPDEDELSRDSTIVIKWKNLIGFDYKGTIFVKINWERYEPEYYSEDSSSEEVYIVVDWLRENVGKEQLDDMLDDIINGNTANDNYHRKGLPDNFDLSKITNFAVKICPYVEWYWFTNECAEKQIRLKRTFYTDDTYSYKQYRLKKLRIIDAWKSVDKVKYVPTIAIIDDWINIHHPDISSNIWVNEDEIPGNGIDDDNNGFIDDYNWWNFIYDNNNLLPLGPHWSMVAGIIAAVPNNKEGIAWITKWVKIMAIGACIDEKVARSLELTGGWWCSMFAVISGIKYAVDNGANIINLSLWGNQFTYSTEYDEILHRALNKGVIVVIAAGNGDPLQFEEHGINTSITPISPVCNLYSESWQIGVGATTKEDKRAPWSNYWKCVDFFAPGERIFSVSMNLFEGQDYDIKNWTSFSSPMIAGIIGLAYNKYGHNRLSSEVIYNALKTAFSVTKDGRYYLDANKFLKNIPKQNLIQQQQKEREKEIKETYDVLVKKVRTKLDKYITRQPSFKQQRLRQQVKSILLKYVNKIKDEKRKYLIDELLKKINEKIWA